jgi:hypothetical protein
MRLWPMNAARGLQIRPAHKIKPAGVAQHVQVDVQRRKIFAAQMFARAALIGDAPWPELCSILSIYRCCLDQVQARRVGSAPLRREDGTLIYRCSRHSR